MTTDTSEGILSALRPLLPGLSRMVAASSSVGDEALRSLLIGSDLDEDPHGLAELRRWVRLLDSLRSDPTRDRRQSTTEALRLRGFDAADIQSVFTLLRLDNSFPVPRPTVAAKVSSPESIAAFSLPDEGRSIAWGDINSLVFARPDALLLVAGNGAEGGLALWNLTSGAIEWEIEQPFTTGSPSHDGRLFATVGSVGLQLLSLETRQVIRTFRSAAPWSRCLAFSPDDRVLVAGGNDHSVRMWDVAGGRRLHTRTTHKSIVQSVAFSPDGSLFASAGNDHQILIWDPVSFAVTKQLRGHTNGVRALVFCPDSRTLISAGEDKLIRIWDIATGVEASRLAGHTGWIYDLALTSDGRTLASCSRDKTVRIWDMGLLREQYVLRGHSKSVRSLAFSKDDAFLAAGASLGAVRIWRMNQTSQAVTNLSSVPSVSGSRPGSSTTLIATLSEATTEPVASDAPAQRPLVAIDPPAHRSSGGQPELEPLDPGPAPLRRMSIPLSSDEIAQTIPILGSVARIIANGSPVHEAVLRTLLIGAGLEGRADILAEVDRWANLLAAAHERPDLREATCESLLLRGLPEVSVMPALATVTAGSSQGPEAPVANALSALSASVDRLDFGTLPPDQRARAEFTVAGGPGQIVVESDQIRVAPTEFGSGTTAIIVEVRPMAGAVLWSAIKLITAGRSLDIPLIAQWQSAVVPSPATSSGPIVPFSRPIRQPTPWPVQPPSAGFTAASNTGMSQPRLPTIPAPVPRPPILVPPAPRSVVSASPVAPKVQSGLPTPPRLPTPLPGRSLKISARIIQWPMSCACCSGHADTTMVAYYTRVTGQRVVRTNTNSWKIPICGACLAHASHFKKSRGVMQAAFNWSVVASLAIAGLAFLAQSGFILLGCPILIIVFLLAGYVHEKSLVEHAEGLRLPSCCRADFPVYYGGWYGSIHTFHFANGVYAALFTQANAGKMLG